MIKIKLDGYCRNAIARDNEVHTFEVVKGARFYFDTGSIGPIFAIKQTSEGRPYVVSRRDYEEYGPIPE